MEEILRTVIVIFLYMTYILLSPVILLLATPFILLRPGRKGPGGTRGVKDIRGRYRKIWKLWESIGLGLPTS